MHPSNRIYVCTSLYHELQNSEIIFGWIDFGCFQIYYANTATYMHTYFVMLTRAFKQV